MARFKPSVHASLHRLRLVTSSSPGFTARLLHSQSARRTGPAEDNEILDSPTRLGATTRRPQICLMFDVCLMSRFYSVFDWAREIEPIRKTFERVSRSNSWIDTALRAADGERERRKVLKNSLTQKRQRWAVDER